MFISAFLLHEKDISYWFFTLKQVFWEMEKHKKQLVLNRQSEIRIFLTGSRRSMVKYRWWNTNLCHFLCPEIIFLRTFLGFFYRKSEILIAGNKFRSRSEWKYIRLDVMLIDKNIWFGCDWIFSRENGIFQTPLKYGFLCRKNAIKNCFVCDTMVR
jgi:hypothetical protein